MVTAVPPPPDYAYTFAPYGSQVVKVWHLHWGGGVLQLTPDPDAAALAGIAATDYLLYYLSSDPASTMDEFIASTTLWQAWWMDTFWQESWHDPSWAPNVGSTTPQALPAGDYWIVTVWGGADGAEPDPHLPAGLTYIIPPTRLEPTVTTPTSQGQGGTGGGNQPPASNKDTEAAQGGTEAASSVNVPGPPATQPDTTRGGPLGGVGQTGDTDSHSRDPLTTPPDTTVGGGNIGATAAPAYRAPGDNPPATIRDTSYQGADVRVTSGSPDAAAVGGGTTPNPNAVEPGQYGSGATQPGTIDTRGYGSPPLTTVPSAGSPTAPTAVSAALIANRNAVTVSWTPPSNAAAANVLGYVVENNTGGTTNVGKDATSVEFEQGLVPGGTYTFTVYARTANGTGPRSAASAPLTLPSIRNMVADTTTDEGLTGPADRLAGAPTSVAATAGVGQATVTWAAPASNGGSAITGYRVTASTGQVVNVGNVLTATVTGLATVATTFTVKAINGYGPGAASAASNSVTPT